MPSTTPAFRTAHRGAGPRRRPMTRTAVRANAARYAVGTPRQRTRLIAVRLATLATIALALLTLGLVGRADLQRECDEVWSFANVTATSADRLTCADRFPGRYPATDLY